MTEDQRFRLQQWINGLRIAHIAHNRTAAELASRHRVLGVTATALSAVVGASIFTVLSENPKGWMVGIVGAVSLLAAMATGFVAFLDYSGRAQTHSAVAHQYGHLRRRAEGLLDSRGDAPGRVTEMAELNDAWQELDKAAPPCPTRIHDWAVQQVPPAQP